MINEPPEVHIRHCDSCKRNRKVHTYQKKKLCEACIKEANEGKNQNQIKSEISYLDISRGY